MSTLAAAAYLGAEGFKFSGAFRRSLPNGRCGMHQHPCFEIVYHDGGAGTVELDGAGTMRFAPGSVVIHPPRIAHDQESTGTGDDICVLLTGPEKLDVPPELQRLVYVPSVSRPWILADINRLLVADRQDRSRPELSSHDHRAAALFLELMDLQGDDVGSANLASWQQTADLAEARLQLDYASIHTVREVAQASSVSDGYLRHIFKKRFGIGIKRRLNQIRILRACDLLSGSTLAIKVIAHLCGFDNDRHFSTCFHTEMACSPGDYRRLGGDCQRKS